MCDFYLTKLLPESNLSKERDCTVDNLMPFAGCRSPREKENEVFLSAEVAFKSHPSF